MSASADRHPTPAALRSHAHGAAARYAAVLRERFGSRVLELRVFGSYARGDIHEHSDLDLFVLLDEVSWADRVAALELAGDVWRETDLLVSPLILPRAQYEHWLSQERSLALSIEREGIPL